MGKIIIISILLLAPLGVFGNEVTIQPGPEIGQDTFGCDDYPYENCGDWVYMLAGETPHTYNAFLRFTQLDEYIGYEITYAHLSIAISPIIYGSVCRFHRVLEPWDEDTLTWANQPPHSDGEYCSESADYGDITMTIDVTWMVQKWVDEEWENFGWCIKGSWSLVIYTSESVECPILLIQGPDLPELGVQPTSLGKIKSLFTPQLEYSGGGGRIGRQAPHRSWMMGLRG